MVERRLLELKMILKMLKHGLSDDWIAWYLIRNTNVARWEQAKKVAKEIRDDYDGKNDKIEERIE